MKLRKLARQLAAAAVAGAMTLSLCMPALAQTWNISNGSHGFSEVDSVCVTGTTSGRTVELFGGESSLSQTETDETVLSGSGATYTSLNGHSAPVSVALNELNIMLEDRSGSGACIRTGGDVSVDLRGKNILTIPGNYGIYSEKGSLTLGGTGTLNIRSGHGIRMSDSFTLNSGIVDIAETETSTMALQSGITADTITLNGGRIHVSIAPPTSEDYYNDALYARKGIFIRGGSVVTKTANTVSGADTVQHRALHSLEGDIVISGGSVQAEGGELYAGGSIQISNGIVNVDILAYDKGLTISGGEVNVKKGFSGQANIVLSGSAKVTCDNYLSGALWRFNFDGLTTDGYLRYKPNPLDTDAKTDAEGYVVIRGEKEPPAPADTDAGNAPAGDAGGALAAVAIGGAALWGGYEVATRVILHNLLPEGAAIPKTQAQLAVLLWNTAGQPEPANAPAFADVDAATAKAAQWCTEQGYLSGTFQPAKRVAKYNVIRAWNKAFPKAA